MLGQRINNFSIVRLLGEGGMGTVYEAEHALIRKKIAVKVLKAELSADRALVQRFFNEARATSQIRHPNIVEIIDVGMLADNVPYLVMELLEGESLNDRLQRQGPLDIAVAAEFARQAASGLQAAHDAGIIHRDLKPENLFLVRDQRFAGRELVKVLDFGIAKLHGQLATPVSETLAGVVFGTPPYMSPEQCRGLPMEVDERTDVYSLGVILYEMICGLPPFLAEGLGELMMLHMSHEPVPPSQYRPELSDQLERVILRALAKRPEHRLTSMAEFELELTAVAASVMGMAEQNVRMRTSLMRGSAAVAFSAEEPGFVSVAPSHLMTTSRASGYTRRQPRSDPRVMSASAHDTRDESNTAPNVELSAIGSSAPVANETRPLVDSSIRRSDAALEPLADEDFEIEVEEPLAGSRRAGARAALIAGATAVGVLALALGWAGGTFWSPIAAEQSVALGPEAGVHDPRAEGASRTGAPVPIMQPGEETQVLAATAPSEGERALAHEADTAGTQSADRPWPLAFDDTPTVRKPSAAAQAQPLSAAVAMRRAKQAARRANLRAGRASASSTAHARSSRSKTPSEAVTDDVPDSSAPARRAPPNPYDQPAESSESAAPIARSTESAAAGSAGQLGYLSLDSAPWSDVFLGDERLGTTPLIRVPLPTGKHLLTLRNPELNASTSYLVEIQAGKTVSRMVGWEPQ